MSRIDMVRLIEAIREKRRGYAEALRKKEALAVAAADKWAEAEVTAGLQLVLGGAASFTLYLDHDAPAAPHVMHTAVQKLLKDLSLMFETGPQNRIKVTP